MSSRGKSQSTLARLTRRLVGVAGALAIVAAMSLTSLDLTVAFDKRGVPIRSDAPPYVPDEILVKFNHESAKALQRQIPSGGSPALAAARIELPDSLNRLAVGYGVKRITPVFERFSAVRQRLEGLVLADPAKLTRAEERLITRSRRAPAHASLPTLERFYRLELAAGASVDAAVADYASDPNVEYAEPNYLFRLDLTPNDPHFDMQWSLHNTGQPYPNAQYGTLTGTPDSDVDAPEAWEIYSASDPVIVAIVDSGVDYNHPDLTASMWTDDKNGGYGYDFANDDDDPMDDLGHGTLCAGIVAAAFNNGVGISGLCPNARIMAV